MQPDELVVSTSDLGRVSVSTDAVAQLVRHAALESYGVVGLAGGGRWARLLPWRARRAIDVRSRDGAVAVEVGVVVEHGLRLAEVAEKTRSRVEYELGRVVELPVAEVDVHIERVRAR